MEISCSNCGRVFPQEGMPYRCPTCGGLYDFFTQLPFDPAQVDRSQPGIWCYRHTFGLPQNVEPVSLGEGCTPLLWTEAFGHKIAFKCEFLNPSGSFKDRGSTLIATWLHVRGITEALEDSSGNAGASFAAYATRAGIKARIFVPMSASGPKRRQIEACGAEMVPISGSRTDVTEAVKTVADGGKVYASHAYLPFNLPGYATAAYEIYEQCGNKMPGTIILPVGQGGMLLGLARGFKAICRANNISDGLPRIIGVQARTCAPLWAIFTGGGTDIGPTTGNFMLAEGVQVQNPLRGEEVLQVVKASNGSLCIVEENEILPGYNALARFGCYVEPTSAIVWSALTQMIQDLNDPVIVVLTGSGYKYE